MLSASDRASLALKVLWITEYSDRGERAQVNGLRSAGVDIHLMCPKHSPFHERYASDGFDVIDFAPRRRIDRDAANFIRSYAREHQIDIVHTFNARAVTAAILALRSLPEVKLVAYRGIVGNLSFLDPMSWYRYLNRRIDTIVCVAEAIRQFFLNMRPRLLLIAISKIPRQRAWIFSSVTSVSVSAKVSANMSKNALKAGSIGML